MHQPSPAFQSLSLFWHYCSEFSDSGEPSVFKQSVYVHGLRSLILSQFVCVVAATTQAWMPPRLCV